ncbi:unnamed protein product [Trifolium pratense]|uniref:Uncharacterized protein n=1 Tax=Trifolium pratense TaxID=57577 RepID=A0ACB0KAD7_TRIPR|nr:unnamed protein product [Trifolium pratense]
MTTMNEFPPRVLESLDSMDAFDDSSPNLQLLREFLDEVIDFDGISCVDVDGAIDNLNLEIDDVLDNMLRNTLDDYTKNYDFEAVKLSKTTTLENHQHQNSVEPETEDTSGDVSLLQSSQTESFYINLEADECVNYSTPSSSVSDIAADATFSNKGFSPYNGDDCLCSEYNDNRIGGQCNLMNGEASGRGIELAQPLNTSSMVLKEHFVPGAILGTSPRRSKSFDQRSSKSNHCFNGSISTMEKYTDLSEHLQAEHLKAKSSPDTSSCVTDELKIIEYFPVEEKSRSYPMSIEYIQQHLHILSDSAAAINFPDMDDSDDIEIIENFPVQNKSRSSLEDGSREKYCTPTENLEHFPHMYDYAPISNEVFNDDVQIIDNSKLDWSPTLQMHRVSNDAADNEVFNDDVQIIDNFKLDWSPTLQMHRVSNDAVDNEVFNDDVQIIDNFKLDWSPTLQMHRVSNDAVDNEVFNDDVQIIDNLKLDWSPTLQMHRVSNAAVDNEVFNDDVQIIDNIKLDFWAERPAKKMRLMHFPGGSDGILTSFSWT